MVALRATAQGVPAVQTGPVSVQVSQQIFATMCALDAAGFDATADTASEGSAIVALQAKSTSVARTSFGSSPSVLSRTRTGWLGRNSGPLHRIRIGRRSASGFSVSGQKEDQLPPEVLQIQGFREILASFYQEAHLDRTWAQFQPAYEKVTERYSHAVASHRHHVQWLPSDDPETEWQDLLVYLEPLVGTRNILRNSGDQYSIVIGLTPDVPEDEIRHAYLHFILDPLTLQYRKEIQTKSALAERSGARPGTARRIS